MVRNQTKRQMKVKKMRDQFRLMFTEIIAEGCDDERKVTRQINDIQTNSIREIRRLVKVYQKSFGPRGKVFAERLTFDKFGSLNEIILLEDPWEELKHGSFGRAN